MPVRKYRSIEEMPDETWREPGDPLLYRAIQQIWDFGRRTSRRRYPAGVYRFRSIGEMDAASASGSAPLPHRQTVSPSVRSAVASARTNDDVHPRQV